MFWGPPWNGLRLVCHVRVQSFHHKSAHFPTPVPLYALKQGKNRAKHQDVTSVVPMKGIWPEGVLTRTTPKLRFLVKSWCSKE